MLKDRVDILLGASLLVCVIVVAALLAGDGSHASQQSLSVDKALERDMAYQAKVSFLERLYAPVIELQEESQYAAALLKLDELFRRYPEEAHGELLRGEILLQMQTIPKAIEHIAKAVRMSADYVDQNSPLSRHKLIGELVDAQLPKLKADLAKTGGERLQATLKDLYYLQGRLAGGCE